MSSFTRVGKLSMAPVSSAVWIIRLIARPATTTDRPAACALSASVFRRATFDANVVAATAPFASRISFSSGARSGCSPPAEPGSKMLVLSHISASTPSSPSFSSRAMSVALPRMGAGSSLKSPVCTILPAAVSIRSIAGSGMECVTCMKLTAKGPASIGVSQAASWMTLSE